MDVFEYEPPPAAPAHPCARGISASVHVVRLNAQHLEQALRAQPEGDEQPLGCSDYSALPGVKQST